jgi:hypothetical protein
VDAPYLLTSRTQQHHKQHQQHDSHRYKDGFQQSAKIVFHAGFVTFSTEQTTSPSIPRNWTSPVSRRTATYSNAPSAFAIVRELRFGKRKPPLRPIRNQSKGTHHG